MDKCSRSKQWVLRWGLKKEMNKIAPLSSKCFKNSKERYVLKEQSRIRISHHIYPPYIHTHAHLDLIV
jgi:hypothetical protein